MSESSLKLQKPMAITIICFIGVINAAQLSFMVWSPVSRQLGAFYPYYFASSAVISLVSVTGLWFLRKWAAWLYIFALISNQLVLVSMGLWEFSAVLIPAIIIALLLKNLDKMS
ncbi:hypothetical protein Q9L42_009285 [Methylomarinum sp. Ch1-1]|uniref:Uncharacterized protein n=1 Tax=Methylomarinum roseum TaxID=3067653 RepID=A0AAU7NZ91_9GAMM|nr:hypothetical protein [Methylomarinum sp. Ch1-1]MDP4521573.1 hypothetical protein [Methylomarinum sp. Ch1-1]